MAHELTVVGGGLAGLISAIALAERGARVKLLERSTHLGGRAATQHQKDFALNMGAHALYRNGPLFQTLQRWRIPFAGHAPKLGASAYLVANGRKYTFPSDAMHLTTTGVLTLAEKLEAANLLRKLSTESFLPDAQLTVEQWLDREKMRAPVRKLAEMLIRLSTYSCELNILSAASAVTQVRLGIQYGVLYLNGGWETLIIGLAAKAKELGVIIATGETVKTLKPGTILAIPPNEVQRLTGASLPPVHPVRAACLDLGLRRLPKPSALFAMDLDQPLYLSVHSASAALAPKGAALVHIIQYLKADETPKLSQLESFADFLMPGWRNEVKVHRFLPKMTVAYAIPSPLGRTPVQLTACPGVALAGDWVGSRNMLADAAAASALAAAELVWEHRAAAA